MSKRADLPPAAAVVDGDDGSHVAGGAAAARERELEAELFEARGRMPDRRASGELLGFFALRAEQLPPLERRSSSSSSSGGDSPAAGAAGAGARASGSSGASPDAVLDVESQQTPRCGGAGEGGEAGRGASKQLLQPLAPDARLVLSFRRLSVWAPASPQKPSVVQRLWRRCFGGGGGSAAAAAERKRQILHAASGAVHPGELLALMGPSGSGKTSLLTVLGGRSTMKFRGEVLVNGQPLTKEARRRVGFVLQDDVLYESLTIRETLSYAALLRLPSSMPRRDKMQRVDQVVEALGLRKSAGTIIGGFFRRGISGGERKRVSIGHELLINPAIILLDEPTSGLDSTTAMHLVSLLQDLAAGGRSVATTIHQPSSRLYQKLDRLMLLAEGHVMYYGRADKVVDFFSRWGYSVPFGVSIADWILDISLGEAGYSRSGRMGAAAVAEVYTAYEQMAAAQEQQQQGQGQQHLQLGWQVDGDQRRPKPDQRRPKPDQRRPPGGGAAAATPGGAEGGGKAGAAPPQPLQQQPHQRQQQPRRLRRAPRPGASYPEQLRVLVQRAGRVRRFEQMTGQHFFQLLAVAFITGLVWWQRGQDYGGGVQAASDVMGLLFFMLLFPSMRALFRALFTFPNEHRMLLKERPSGMYRLSSYYLARTAADLPAELLNTLLFVVVAYWFGGLRHSAAGFFGLLFSLALVVAVAESWGLLIGGVFMEPKTAQTVTTVVILTFLLVGGYYVRNIPVWIGWIRYLSFLFWGYNLLLKSQLSGVTYRDAHTGAPVSLAPLSLPTDPEAPAYPDVLVLLAMLVVLRVAIYFVLLRKTRVRQRNLGPG